MRYLLQVIAMLGDLMFWGCVIFLLVVAPNNPIIWIVCLLGFFAWKEHGFQAWNPANQRKFLANAKSYGL